MGGTCVLLLREFSPSKVITMVKTLLLLLSTTWFVGLSHSHPRHVWDEEQTIRQGFVWRGNASESHEALPLPEHYPSQHNWCDLNGTSYCTVNLNQHIPQYCGSCWAQGAVYALADRVKIARKSRGIDVVPSVQHVLNCGGGGSCNGGSAEAAYQWWHNLSETGTGVAFASQNPYVACSSDIDYGLCRFGDFSCQPINVAYTCGTFPSSGGRCVALSRYPNVTVSDYGSISGVDAMKREIFHRGPIACGVDADEILNYSTGIVSRPGGEITHIVAVVGWGLSTDGTEFWTVRNSWGESWGEMGYFRVKTGVNSLSIESQCSWAVPGSWTELSTQSHCSEDGLECDL
jgi:cathepsin X